jgi:hypothetical protein
MYKSNFHICKGTILNASHVDFPSAIKLSDEGKEFIRMCLTPDQKYRPDVYQLCQCAYLKNSKPKAEKASDIK